MVHRIDNHVRKPENGLPAFRYALTNLTTIIRVIYDKHQNNVIKIYCLSTDTGHHLSQTTTVPSTSPLPHASATSGQ